eukprot:559496-Pleurochrysis_carterae.AAC.3
MAGTAASLRFAGAKSAHSYREPGSGPPRLSLLRRPPSPHEGGAHATEEHALAHAPTAFVLHPLGGTDTAQIDTTGDAKVRRGSSAGNGDRNSEEGSAGNGIGRSVESTKRRVASAVGRGAANTYVFRVSDSAVPAFLCEDASAQIVAAPFESSAPFSAKRAGKYAGKRGRRVPPVVNMPFVNGSGRLILERVVGAPAQ